MIFQRAIDLQLDSSKNLATSMNYTYTLFEIVTNDWKKKIKDIIIIIIVVFIELDTKAASSKLDIH